MPKAKTSPVVDPPEPEGLDPLEVWLVDRGFRLEGGRIVCAISDLPAAISRLHNRIAQAAANDPRPWTDARVSATWHDGELARVHLTGVRL